MKILVFDDSLTNRLSAQLTLAEHDVKVVGSYDEAQSELSCKLDREKQKQLEPGFLEAAGFSRDQKSGGLEGDDYDRFWDAWKKAREAATSYSEYDVVLTDLMVPASRQALGSDGTQFAGQEMPLGSIIALRALRFGVRNVAVVTDMSHHDHPASAAFDGFGKKRCEHINVMCTNRPEYVAIDIATQQLVSKEFRDSEAGKIKYPLPEGQGYGPRQGLEYGKDWGDILQRLMERK